ncbi:MAG TPA: helix-turn-helix transcriptional regulator [Candidatus Limnocylindrales bacterium]|nr:helix-turn-helix transcriptional regulator [Candidatus Limnocylindrales bacterium]
MNGLMTETEAVLHLGTAPVRERYAELAGAVEAECLALNGGLMHEDGHCLVKRGIRIRAVYQESFRNDWRSLAEAQRLAVIGAEVRSVPRVPAQMVVYDREIALLPAAGTNAPGGGVVEVRSPDVIAVLCGIFDQLWSAGHPVDGPVPLDGNGLDPVERELLQLLSDGHTDASAGRKLGVSARTVQRMMSDLTARLKAESRFQAGVTAVRLGWL